jgi:hypothetical protein
MFLGSRAWPVRRADNVAAICEPIVYTMWGPYHSRTLLGGQLYVFFFCYYLPTFEYLHQSS